MCLVNCRNTDEIVVANTEKGESRVGRGEVRKIPGTRSHQTLQVIGKLDVRNKRRGIKDDSKVFDLSYRKNKLAFLPG